MPDPSVVSVHELREVADKLDMTMAIFDVYLERHRQRDSEGFSHAHDDSHDSGELAAAGCAYALNAACELHPFGHPFDTGEPPLSWPWDAAQWKPKTPRADLVRAAALIIAEIERLDRVTLKEGSDHGEQHRSTDG